MSVKLSSPEVIMSYFNQVNGKDLELNDKRIGYIKDIEDEFNPEEIKYAIDNNVGTGFGVLFQSDFFRNALTRRTLENQHVEAVNKEAIRSLDILSQALVGAVQVNRGDELVEFCKKYIENTYGIQPCKIPEFVKLDGSKIPGVQHEKFKNVCRAISAKNLTLLKGPAGTGKSYIAKQIADAYGMEFYEMGSVQQEYKLFGFMSSDGKKYMDTPVYRACKTASEGRKALLLLDELDGSFAEVLLAINNMLASMRCTFPNGETLEFADNLCVIATANTWGMGADDEYVGRSQLDKATLNRFTAQISIDYSPAIESAMCPDSELLEFLRDFRNNCTKVRAQHLVTVRNIRALYTVISNNPNDDIKEILSEYLVQGMTRNSLSTISNRLMGSNKYVRAIQELAGEGLND